MYCFTVWAVKQYFGVGADGGMGIIARANNKVINGKSLNLGVGEIRLNLSLFLNSQDKCPWILIMQKDLCGANNL